MFKNGLTNRKRVVVILGLVLLMLAPMAVIPIDVVWPQRSFVPTLQTTPETKNRPTWEEWCVLNSQHHKHLPFKPLVLRPLWENQ